MCSCYSAFQLYGRSIDRNYPVLAHNSVPVLRRLLALAFALAGLQIGLPNLCLADLLVQGIWRYPRYSKSDSQLSATLLPVLDS